MVSINIPKLESLLSLHWSTFYSIALLSVLCLPHMCSLICSFLFSFSSHYVPFMQLCLINNKVFLPCVSLSLASGINVDVVFLWNSLPCVIPIGLWIIKILILWVLPSSPRFPCVWSWQLHSFDASLCLMIMLDYTWIHLLFRFLLHLCCLEILDRRCVLAPHHITMKTLILGAQV